MKRAVQVQISSQTVINTRTSEPTERPDLGSPWSVATLNELRYAELAHLTLHFNRRMLRLPRLSVLWPWLCRIAFDRYMPGRGSAHIYCDGQSRPPFGTEVPSPALRCRRESSGGCAAVVEADTQI